MRKISCAGTVWSRNQELKTKNTIGVSNLRISRLICVSLLINLSIQMMACLKNNPQLSKITNRTMSFCRICLSLFMAALQIINCHNNVPPIMYVLRIIGGNNNLRVSLYKTSLTYTFFKLQSTLNICTDTFL